MHWSSAVATELLRLAVRTGRYTWVPAAAFGLAIVLVHQREGQFRDGLLAWFGLMVVLLARAYLCRWMTAMSGRQRFSRTRWLDFLAGAEALAWSLTLLIVPSASPAGSLIQFAAASGAALVGIVGYGLSPGISGTVYTAVFALGQLFYLLSHPVPLAEAVALAWVLAMSAASFWAWWLRNVLAANLALREKADKGVKVQENAVAELHRSREQLRLALDAIDAGVSDTNLITGERFFSARYAEILGFRDRKAFLESHRFSEALHEDDRERILEARRRHLEEDVRFQEEFRLRTATLRYVWVQGRGESIRGSDGKATRFVMSIVDVTERRRAERQLEESERRYRALVEASPSLIWMCDSVGRITFVSARAAKQLYGYEPRDMVGRHVTSFNAPGTSPRTVLRKFRKVLRGHPVFDVEITHLTASRQPLVLTVSAQPTLDEHGKVESILGVASDITTLKRRETELNVALRNQQAVFEAAGEGIVFVRDGRIENANRALAKMLDVPRDWLNGRPAEAILADPNAWKPICMAAEEASERGEAAIHEVMLRTSDESRQVVWCQLTSRKIGGQAMILVLTDITVLKRREELAWHQANHDELTGLPNRRLLMEHARRLLSVAMRQKRLAAVMVLDLDGFKEVNDQFGHSHGDILLRRVALRLSSVLREYDVVARTGGDEFVVLMPEIEQPAIAMVVAEKLIAASSEHLEGGGRSLRIHASVGIALFPSDGHDFDTLLARADEAMYAAKNAGKNQFRLASDNTGETLVRIVSG